MRYFILALCLLGFSPHAQAQNNPVIEAGKTIFTEIERQVIRDVLGRAGLPTPETATNDADDNDYANKDEDKGKGHKKKDKKKHKKHKKDKKHKGKSKSKGKPPGLSKKGKLPPGLAKRDTLPPGLDKRELPEEITSQLPPPPAGTERVIVDSSVILVEKGTQIVLDVIKDVFLTK